MEKGFLSIHFQIHKIMSEIQMAAKLYKCRDTCKNLYGADWKNKVSFHTNLIHAAMKKYSIDNEIEAAIMLVKQLENNGGGGFFAVKCFAAAVELIEPSN